MPTCAELVAQHGSKAAAARFLGIASSTFKDRMEMESRQNCAITDASITGKSTLYDAKGNTVMEWVKTQATKADKEQALITALKALTEEFKGLSPIVQAPKQCDADLMVVYPVGDPHIGMYSWADETGEDFDLKIAEDTISKVFDRLIPLTPPAETALVNILGDTLHADDQSNQTPAHKHQLDVDSRFPKVLMVAIRIYRHKILRLLEKHQNVIVRIEPGNHDPHAVWAIKVALAAYFENNKRVMIDLTPGKLWYYRFGKVLIGSTHGDTVKHATLPGLMACERAKDWGETEHRYWYTGHIHTQTVHEYPGVICESFRTLATKDAYTTAYGYRSGRDQYAIVHHKEYGEIGRLRCDARMVA